MVNERSPSKGKAPAEKATKFPDITDDDYYEEQNYGRSSQAVDDPEQLIQAANNEASQFNKPSRPLDNDQHSYISGSGIEIDPDNLHICTPDELAQFVKERAISYREAHVQVFGERL
jgi:hypothetical protein